MMNQKRSLYLALLAAVCCCNMMLHAQYQARMSPPLKLTLESDTSLRFLPFEEGDIKASIDAHGNGMVYYSARVTNNLPASRGRMIVKILREDEGIVASTTRSVDLNHGETRVNARLYISPNDLPENRSFRIQVEIYGRDRQLADTHQSTFSF